MGSLSPKVFMMRAERFELSMKCENFRTGSVYAVYRVPARSHKWPQSDLNRRCDTFEVPVSYLLDYRAVVFPLTCWWKNPSPLADLYAFEWHCP